MRRKYLSLLLWILIFANFVLVGWFWGKNAIIPNTIGIAVGIIVCSSSQAIWGK